MAPKVGTTFAFVTVGDHGKPKVADRKLIRSHCMKGKNKRKQPQTRVPEGKLATRRLRQPNSSDDSIGDLEETTKDVAAADQACVDPNKEISAVQHQMPPAAPPDLTLIKFAGEVDDISRELLFKCPLPFLLSPS
jgi:hypothetical protein